MEWAVVTWAVLIGMVGLLWVMVLAVVQDGGDSQSSADEDQEQPEESFDSRASVKHRHAA